MTWKPGDQCIIRCDGENYLAEIALASKNGKSLVATFNSLIAGHLGMMPLMEQSSGLYKSIINEKTVQLLPLPKDWLTRQRNSK